MINGKVFDWEDIRVDAPFGLNLVILAISYKSGSITESMYGRGRAARGFGRGNLVQEGSFEIESRSFLQLDVFAKTQGGFHNIPAFPISISYSNNDQIPQNVVLRSVTMDSFETDATQGDTEIGKYIIPFKIHDPILINGSPVL